MQDLVKNCEKFLGGFGFNLSAPGMEKTPERVVKALKELLKGESEPTPKITTFPIVYASGSNDIIMSDCIPFTSMCAHHVLPFMGYMWVLYIPGNEVIGFSKLARVAQHFAARLQTQEELVNQIADEVFKLESVAGVMVFSRAKHTCAMCRGAKSGWSNGLTTSTVRGIFAEDNSLELKGLEMIKLSLAIEGGL